MTDALTAVEVRIVATRMPALDATRDRRLTQAELDAHPAVQAHRASVDLAEKAYREAHPWR